MKKLETQIRHLKKEIKEIEESEIESKARDKEQIEKNKQGRKILAEYQARYLELLDEYDASVEILNKYSDEKTKIREEVNSKILFFKKSDSEIDFPEDLERIYESAYRKVKEKEEEIRELNNKYREEKFSTVRNTHWGVNTKRFEVKKHIEVEFMKIDNSIRYYEKQINSTEVNEEYEKKKRKLAVLEKRLQKRNKEKTLANAYLKKSRVDASTVRARLRDFKECPYCGNNEKAFEADHIYPISLGGLSVKENMIYVCKTCNRNKGGLTLREFIRKFGLDRDYIERRLEELGKKF